MMPILNVMPVVLYTDAVVWLLLLLLALYVWHVRRTPALSLKWKKVLMNRQAVACGAVLSVFFAITLTDSIHYRMPLEAGVYDTRTVSLLDSVLEGRIAARERSYSAPFALRDFDKTTVIIDGKPVRDFQRLTGAGKGIDEDISWLKLMRKFEVGVVLAAGSLIGFWLLLALVVSLIKREGFLAALKRVTATQNPWRPAICVWLVAILISCVLYVVWPLWHVFGTDATGNDVLFTALKSVRTAVVIGSLATLTTLPFAVIFGIAAGYFRGWVDDVIQYIYTTISSIPSVLLIAASVLMIQVFIDKNPQLYQTGLERADLRLFLLAAIIGMTGWAGLARLLRAETMKVSGTDFVSAARAFGVSPLRIMSRHVLPNVMHIVLIVTVLDFSGIVLYEAVLSYVGVGVDPVMQSFGSMINSAASEMSRSPTVWWNLMASFVFMVTLVLSANLFASGVRDAFDPRTAAKEAGHV